MASHKNIVPFFLKWEGGLSRDTKDSASNNPAPWPYKGLTGWHTNKGITYTTFVTMAPRMGYDITPDNFFIMPNEIWGKIMKGGYWDPYQLDDMQSQAIADTVVSWAWGSGIVGSFKQFKKYLATKNINVNIHTDVTRAFNELVNASNEEKIFLELAEWRANYFKSLNQPHWLQGWLNRLEEFKKFGLETIKKKRIRITLIAGALILIVIGSLVYYFSNYARINSK